MTPLASAPPADADVLDLIIDPIINPLQAALTGMTDALAGLDPTAGLESTAGLDLGNLLDPSSLGSSAADLASAGSVGVGAASSSDPLAALASSWDAQATTWFDQYVYLPLHTDMENWINSPIGEQVDGFINQLSGQDLIGNGAPGTAADPNGGNAGLLFGDGGNGGNSGAGSGGIGGDGVAGGTGGNGGTGTPPGHGGTGYVNGPPGQNG